MLPVCRPNRGSYVVGYFTSNMVAQTTTMTGVPFCNVSGEDLDIQAIRVFNAGALAGDGEYQMKWYDNGRYITADWWDPLNTDVPGWGDGDYDPIDKTFAAGEWFLLAPDSSIVNPSVQVAGALVSTDTKSPTYTITLTAETTTSTGNPFPTDCDINSIVAMNGNAVAGDGEYQMKWYDNGRYITVDWWDPLNNDLAGWGDENYDPVEKTFLPGQGFLVAPDTSISNPSLKVPNPLFIAE